jgi:hypothetical protein
MPLCCMHVDNWLVKLVWYWSHAYPPREEQESQQLKSLAMLVVRLVGTAAI